MMSAAWSCCRRSARGRPASISVLVERRRRRSMQKAEQAPPRSPPPASSCSPRRRPIAIPRALGKNGGPEDWLERIKQGAETSSLESRERKKRKTRPRPEGEKLSSKPFRPPSPSLAPRSLSPPSLCSLRSINEIITKNNNARSTGIPEVEAPDYNSDSSPPPSTSSRPRSPGTTPLGARPRRGAGGSSASSFSSVSSYSSDDEARASVRRQERVLLDAWTGVGNGENGENAPAASLPLVGGASALLLLALLVATGPPS